MSQPQKGVCAEPNLHAQYLLFNVSDDDATEVRAKLARILDIFDHYDKEHYEAMVTGMIAVGESYWQELYPGPVPSELSAFPDVQCDDRSAPVTQCDLFIQIRTDRVDICYAIGLEVMELMRLHAELVESVSGFRYLDGRDLNGFVYGANNPRGLKRREMAIIGDENPLFAGGSYIHVQCYKHDLRRWHSLSERQQEQVMGVTKEHNLVSPECSDSSHVIRAATNWSDESHENLILQGMPYGDMTTQGLFFVCCANSPRIFKSRLYSQVVGTSEGDYDRWLDFTSAESGGAYFAPSVTFIQESVSRF
ncbi:Dyp-type peroxidase [Alteromonas sp. 5E99-2]|uniref:Dyp-type peroxidase n=1 Tax=Alteromonas sp. 5E99-2 TaxID=2817683 RepID=UPI001A989254|nr:Dyp-type peroxidase [Alteromonas sp. 5E99-2]MBO1254661.1 Dyp-type peroxidase [Alteromonas sp. 5E99-2]